GSGPWHAIRLEGTRQPAASYNGTGLGGRARRGIREVPPAPHPWAMRQVGMVEQAKPGTSDGTDAPARAWHTLPAQEVARALGVDPAHGLTEQEAVRRR